MKKKKSSLAARIRLARTSDALALAGMRYAFRSEAGEPVESEAQFVKRCRAWMTKTIRPGNSWRFWIAEYEGRQVGNVSVQFIEKMPNPVAEPERHAYITNLYVIRELRGRQLGAKLLRTALTWCRRNEVDAVILWPSFRSQSLYLRNGFIRANQIFAYQPRLRAASPRRLNRSRAR
jgi:GNAT superfamily N-acetyltransferase